MRRIVCRLFALFVCAVALCACDKAPDFKNLDITGNKQFGSDFSLPDTTGKTRTLADFKGKAVVLFAVTLMPYISGMSGVVYLASAVGLGAVFLGYTWKLYREYSDALARKTFRYSIVYLSLLFGALLVDHYVRTVIGA